MKHPRIYTVLKNAGHSPLKAAQIILDARRGDWWSIWWIRCLTRSHRSMRAQTLH